MNRIDLHDRVAVITGGAQGFGYATALRMLDSGAVGDVVGHRQRPRRARRAPSCPRAATWPAQWSS